MKLAFCLETLYPELPFLSRLDAAKADGVDTIEFWDWNDKDATALEARLQALHMQVSNISGNRLYGMLDTGENESLFAEIRSAASFAQKVHCPRLMLLTQGLHSDGRAHLPAQPLSKAQIIDVLIETGCALGRLADELEMEILIEPLNSIRDHPQYVLDSSHAAFQIIGKINHPRIKILYDVYHMSVMGENILDDIEKNIEWIGYLHFADVPGRHEPGSGRLPFGSIMRQLQKSHYSGFIGLEFFPCTADSHRAVKSARENLMAWDQ